MCYLCLSFPCSLFGSFKRSSNRVCLLGMRFCTYKCRWNYIVMGVFMASFVKFGFVPILIWKYQQFTVAIATTLIFFFTTNMITTRGTCIYIFVTKYSIVVLNATLLQSLVIVAIATSFRVIVCTFLLHFFNTTIM